MLKGNHWIRPTHDISACQPFVPLWLFLLYAWHVMSMTHFSGNAYVEAAVISYG